jgi:hypothetical protein
MAGERKEISIHQHNYSGLTLTLAGYPGTLISPKERLAKLNVTKSDSKGKVRGFI